MSNPSSALAHIIRTIGDRDFAAVAARTLLDLTDFQLAAVVLHKPKSGPVLMFDNFEIADGRRGIENYVSHTYAMNPILPSATHDVSVLRARDFTARPQQVSKALQPYLVPSEDEEMGFRTVGWPERLEEVGLYVSACGGLLEMSLYRERERARAEARLLNELRSLGPALAAAFERHASLAGVALTRTLSHREAEVVDLMLLGCSSEAIALRLDISRHTVKDHRKRIFHKLKVGSLAELFALNRRGAI